MSQDLSTAIAAVKNLAAGYEAVIAIAGALENVESINQAEADARKRLADTQALIDDRNSDLAAVTAKVIEQTDLENAARARAEEVEKTATDRRVEILRSAKESAEQIIADANAEKAKIDANIAAKNDELIAVTSALNKVSDELAELTRRLDEKKDEIRSIVG